MKLLIFHNIKDKSNKNAVASELSVNPFFVGDYRSAANKFSQARLISCINMLREYDLKSKGVNNESATHGELLREMVFRMMH
jgi:DNA polymerase-3 subunit delta